MFKVNITVTDFNRKGYTVVNRKTERKRFNNLKRAQQCASDMLFALDAIIKLDNGVSRCLMTEWGDYELNDGELLKWTGSVMRNLEVRRFVVTVTED